jgi:hypothetical protein
MELFADESQFPVQTLVAPEKVESVVHGTWHRNRLMTPIGGGVRIEARQALLAENLLTEGREGVARQREEIALDHLGEGQWWWD